MNLSLSVLLTILFLGPGFAGYFGLTVAVRSRFVHLPSPAPNSLIFLVLIALCALLAHCAALLLFTLQNFYCAAHACLRLPIDPDAYATLAHLLRSGGPEVRSPTILYELFALGTLCVATFLVSGALTTWDLRRGERSRVAALLYRWLAPYVRDAREGASVITAYVLTKMRHEGLAIGYRGVISEVNLAADGEVSSITLAAVERFGTRLGAGPADGQRTLVLSGMLGTVHIPGREIENIALTILPFCGDEGAGDGAA